MPSTHLKNHESSSILLPGTSRTERRLGLDPPTKCEHETPSNVFRPRNCLYPGSIVQLTPNLGSSTCWGSALGIWGLTWWHRLTLLCLDVSLTLSLNIMIPILIMPTRSPTSERLVMNKHNEPFFALHSALTGIFILKKHSFQGCWHVPSLRQEAKASGILPWAVWSIQWFLELFLLSNHIQQLSNGTTFPDFRWSTRFFHASWLYSAGFKLPVMLGAPWKSFSFFFHRFGLGTI